jgi:hypothetical protein
MPASNFANAIQKGLSFKSTQEQNRLARQQDFLNLDNQRKGALFQDSRVVNSLLKSGQPEQALNVLSNRMNVLEQIGGDASDTREVADFIARGDIQGAVNLLDSVEAAGVQGGFLKSTEPSELSQIELEKARIELANLQNGTKEIDPEFLKEERKSARDAVKTFDKRAGEIRSSFGKVESVLNSGKLNRMKIASAMTSMARLLSPGIVTDQDFKNLSNSTNPIATVLSKLTEKGDTGASVAAELQRYIDPTNPDLFDKDSFMQTAKNVAGAEIPSLIDAFNQAKDRGATAGLSTRAMDTFFKTNKNMNALQGLIKKPVLTHPVLGDVTEDDIQKAMKNKSLTRDQVIAQLKG